MTYKEKHTPFALISFPGDSHIYLIERKDTGENTYSFTSFDGKETLSFNFSDKVNVDVDNFINSVSITLSENKNTDTINKQEYIKLLEKTIRAIKSNDFKKVVISRNIWVDKPNISPFILFKNLCNSFPNSFCHLTFWNEKEIWIGATPELLASIKDNKLNTMSLAGTLPIEEQWDQKEKEEQAFVTTYIKEKLTPFCTNIEIEGPEDLNVSNIKHLVSYFTANLKPNTNFSVAILHPTPAVCGIPLEKSKEFILENESYKRGFYAGYISIIENTIENYFVNLRCGKLYSNGIMLYAGGGITQESNPEKEWTETELKSQFITNNL